ncbi:Serine/Threonine kinase domain protein (macronuclear) [Tetrahymena thermophila SB210]|uniref:Serine/Threonine kinase domain protein n=1 Tax=Tetrahymena thermophila (strain SB210) TaxID=312017 RepID=I7M6S3_TETTS|nr:Serine/Threonine kinase domain protein [Tetrahymena thermophila SB210]EAR86022.1 Serine/Threonine kinase domain protein [Tetrahymena thermophila SB210]|eukprot:XP_976617.1 Serine/Threonine kinase domain protein [Tetrahymena thermophila SB210]
MNTIIAENPRNLINQNKKQPSIANGNAVNEANTKNKMHSQQPTNKPTKLKKVGDYIFIKQIGSGAYSTVHQGKHNQTYQKVAIKMIPNSKLNETIYQRVVSEIKILTRLNHPNIVRIIDFKKTSQNYYLIFEFCSNGDLENYIKKHYEGKISETLCQQVIFQVREAFKELTKHKIVHRDLKLANILVDEEFTIKIADFGFAKHNQDDDLLKSTLGTPITMAPEILNGKQYNEKCDIWSLGVIIYQMVFGKPPFMPAKGGGINGLIREIQKEKFDFPDQIPISEELKNLLRRMLTVDPQKRLNFKELFSNRWITGEFKPGMIGNEVESQDIDLTQSLKQKKKQAKEIQVKQIMQLTQMQIIENEEYPEEEQKDTDQEYLETQVEETQEKDLEDIDIQAIQEVNPANETPTPYVDEALLQTHEKIHLNQINIQKDEFKQEKVLIAGVMKFALSLRKYYEKRIIIFIANCKKYMDFFQKVQNSLCFKNNSFYRNSVILSAVIIASRISDFVKGNISVKIESETHNLGTYSNFTGLFLEKGESDQTNFIHILKKKQAMFVEIIQKLLASQQINISSSNSPEYLFIQNLIKTYSLHQATANNQCDLQIVKDMHELLEIYEKLQLPQLQLQSIIRRQGVDVKKLFGDLNNMFNLIQDTIKADKKYVKFQQSPFEIKIGIAEIPQSEQQFNEIQKKLSQILNLNSENSNNSSYFCSESLETNN